MDEMAGDQGNGSLGGRVFFSVLIHPIYQEQDTDSE